MKKFIKNNIVGFVLGAIIFSGISVFATLAITADQIEYSPNVSVKDKIDDLYTKVKPAYTGTTSVTPTDSEQVLQTAGKYLSSNITVGASTIPSNYKDVTNSTITSASDILSGKKAYLSDGTLATGTRAECVIGKVPKGSGHRQLANFKPSTFLFFNLDADKKYWGNFYNAEYSLTNIVAFNINNQTTYTTSFAGNLTVDNTGLYIDWDTTSYNNLLYLACK